MFNLSRISEFWTSKEITYTDTNVVAGSLSGIVEVEPGQHTSQNGIDPYYKLFFGTYNQTKNTIAHNWDTVVSRRKLPSIECEWKPRVQSDKRIDTFRCNTLCGLFVYQEVRELLTGDLSYDSSLQTYQWPWVGPNYSPVTLAFTDEDKVTGQISGTFTIGPALDEQLVDNYQIFFDDVDGVPIDTAGNQGGQ